MLYSYTHMETVGVKGLTDPRLSLNCELRNALCRNQAAGRGYSGSPQAQYCRKSVSRPSISLNRNADSYSGIFNGHSAQLHHGIVYAHDELKLSQSVEVIHLNNL